MKSVGIPVRALIGALKGDEITAHEGDHGGYLTDKTLVDSVYQMVASGNIQSADDYMKGLGDDKAVVSSWIGVQCDINSVKLNPDATWAVAEPGNAYCLAKGFKKPAAMMRHNICAYMPQFDEGVTPECAARAVDAARRQVPLHREIGEPMYWTMWYLGFPNWRRKTPTRQLRLCKKALKWRQRRMTATAGHSVGYLSENHLLSSSGTKCRGC